jgi:hypothetical protein
MHVVLQSSERTLISLSPDELTGICNALNEVCNDSDLREPEFQTRLGVTRDFLVDLLARMPREVSPTNSSTDRADVWADAGSVHIVCITAHGDPVELGVAEAQALCTQMQAAIAEAE